MYNVYTCTAEELDYNFCRVRLVTFLLYNNMYTAMTVYNMYTLVIVTCHIMLLYYNNIMWQVTITNVYMLYTVIAVYILLFADSAG